MSVRRGLWCASVVLLSSGCGLVSAQADLPASSAPTNSTAAPTPTATPTTSPAVAAAAELTGSADGRPARLSVTTGRVVQGTPPLITADGTIADDCRLSDGTTEYVTATVVFTVPDEPTKGTGTSSNLRLDLSVPSGDGVFVESTDPSTECDGGAGLPAQATLQTQNLGAEHQTVKVYVVAPAGALQGVTLQMTNPRHHADSIDGRAWTWAVRQGTAGTACAGDPNSLCVPLA